MEPRDLSSILITHIHIDHCADLASLLFGAFVTGRTERMKIYGPPGVSGLVTALFDQAYPFASGMLKTLRNVDFDIEVVELAEGIATPVAPGVSATAFRMKHGLVTYGYRLMLDDIIVAFSGDTEPCDELAQLAQGASILVQDCSWPDDNGPRPGHCIPAQIGPIAAAAGVQQVLLHHMFPPCVGHEEAMIASVHDAFRGNVVMGEDLLRVTL